MRQLFVEIENIARKKLGLYINQGKTKYTCMTVEQKTSSKQNKMGQLTAKNYTFEKVEDFPYLYPYPYQ
jgi:hypothetical protein